MWNDEKFIKAMFFAIKAHENQKMIYPVNMPYSAHLLGVLQFAIIGGLTEKDLNWDLLVQTALLHDTVEDTNTTYEQLKNEFGILVADGVLALTKNENLHKKLQMKDCINKIKLLTKEIAMVKLADRLFNMQSRVPVWSKERQEEYKNEAQLICNELGFSNEFLKIKLQSAINSY